MARPFHNTISKKQGEHASIAREPDFMSRRCGQVLGYQVHRDTHNGLVAQNIPANTKRNPYHPGKHLHLYEWHEEIICIPGIVSPGRYHPRKWLYLNTTCTDRNPYHFENNTGDDTGTGTADDSPHRRTPGNSGTDGIAVIRSSKGFQH